MSLLLRIVIAVILGVLAFAILMYFAVFNQGIDALIGAAVGLFVFFGGPTLVHS